MTILILIKIKAVFGVFEMRKRLSSHIYQYKNVKVNESGKTISVWEKYNCKIAFDLSYLESVSSIVDIILKVKPLPCRPGLILNYLKYLTG